jgi:hypothetical protein
MKRVAERPSGEGGCCSGSHGAAVADVRRQWGMEDLVGLEIELGDAVEYPLAGPE